MLMERKSVIAELRTELDWLAFEYGDYTVAVEWDDDEQMYAVWSVGIADGERDIMGAGVCESEALESAIEQAKIWAGVTP